MPDDEEVTNLSVAEQALPANEVEPSAEETESTLTGLVAALEALLDAPAGRRSYRLLWTQLRDLQERVRQAPVMGTEAKTALQQRLRHVSERMRIEQKAQRREAAGTKADLHEALQLIAEGVNEITSVGEAHERRADLAVLRDRIERSGSVLDKNSRQQLWQEWQRVNQSAWDSLVRHWQANEEQLRQILTEAEEYLRADKLQPTRERIRAFHATIAEHEASHRGARELRQVAGRLWLEADDMAKKKHAAYLEHAGRRVQQWRGAQSRNARARVEVAAEVASLTHQAKSAPTDVGAALLRGRLAERQKALSDLEAEDRRLQKLIEAAETALVRG